MRISANPFNQSAFRVNFPEAEITLNGESCDCFEADSREGWVKVFIRNSDGSIQFQDAQKRSPSFEVKRGTVIIKVAPMPQCTPCALANYKKRPWWKNLS